MTYTTTLNAIHAHDPSPASWEKLLKHLGKTEPDDEPLLILTVLDSNGLDDALWCLRALPEEHDAACAAWAAARVAASAAAWDAARGTAWDAARLGGVSASDNCTGKD